MANRIFVNERYRVSGDFRSRAAKFFRASPESLNFDENLDGSIERINSWVESQTNDKIQDLIQPGSVHGATKVVLVNAVYFQVKKNR